MAKVAAAVAAFHGLMQSKEYGDLGWAECLQADMRQRGLTDSGRLLDPVIRPHFATRAQLNRLGAISSWLFQAIARLEPVVLETPALMSHLRLLPAEKALANAPVPAPTRTAAAGLTASVENGSISVRGIDTGAGPGFAYSDLLADMFLSLPIMRDFDRLGFRSEKCGGVGQLLSSIQNAWKSFGGTHPPSIAILEFRQIAPVTEGQLLAGMLQKAGAQARLVYPEQLEFANGKLRAGNYTVDILLRRVDTRELLVHCELDHPLFKAYRNGAVCVLNDFRSSLWQRRSALELLTDKSILGNDALPDSGCIAWTRLVYARRTVFAGATIDLLPFVKRNRERFVLLPNDPSDSGESFVGAELTERAWDRALRLALQRPYVVQEYATKPLDAFPVFRYSQLEVQKLAVTMVAAVTGGSVHGASAALESASVATGRKVAIAPVLAVD